MDMIRKITEVATMVNNMQKKLDTQDLKIGTRISVIRRLKTR